MSGCERFEELIERYLAGDIEPADLEALRQHSRSCSACRRLMELDQELSAVPEHVTYVSEGRFDEMRASVLGRIRNSMMRRGAREASVRGRSTRKGTASEQRAREQRATGSRLPFWKRWSAALGRQPAYGVVAAGLVLVLGFALGRLTAGLTTGQAGFNQDSFVREVVQQASQERGLAGYWDSPFTYSNVSFRPRDNGTVAIDFDVTRHINVTRKMESPMTREILVHAMIDPTAMGARLNAMGVASEVMDETMDDTIRQTLIFILKNDPSMPVRLRALEVLKPHASEPGVQDALLTVLAQDPSVQIRLLAVECLAGKRTDPELIRGALGEPRNDSDRAVLHRAVELLGDI